MEPTQLTDVFSNLGAEILSFLQGLLRRWNLFQLIIAAIAFMVALPIAFLIGRRLRSHMRAWLRTLAGRPRWQLRALLSISKLLPLLIWALLLWETYFIMREVTWPSRSYLLGIIARIVHCMDLHRIRRAICAQQIPAPDSALEPMGSMPRCIFSARSARPGSFWTSSPLTSGISTSQC